MISDSQWDYYWQLLHSKLELSLFSIKKRILLGHNILLCFRLACSSNGTFTIDRSDGGLFSPRELFFLFVEEDSSPFPLITLLARVLTMFNWENWKEIHRVEKKMLRQGKGKVNGIKGFEKKKKNINNQQIKWWIRKEIF